jgi:PEP-CTERM motif
LLVARVERGDNGFEQWAFSITFNTPISQVTGVPEPSTWVMMLLGFVDLGFAGLAKLHAQSPARGCRHVRFAYRTRGDRCT